MVPLNPVGALSLAGSANLVASQKLGALLNRADPRAEVCATALPYAVECFRRPSFSRIVPKKLTTITSLVVTHGAPG